MSAASRVRVAKIGAAHGLRGEVRLFVDADDPLAVKKLGVLEDEAGAREFKIAALREAKDHLLVRFEGVGDRTAAERLTNIELYVPRDRLPKQKDKNRFYQADLIGLRVETNAGDLLGKIVAVQNFGAGDLLEFARENGGATVLIPFADPFVPVVDLEGGKVVIDPPVGLFDSSPSPLEGEGRGGGSKKSDRLSRGSPPSQRASRADLPHKGGGEEV